MKRLIYLKPLLQKHLRPSGGGAFKRLRCLGAKRHSLLSEGATHVNDFSGRRKVAFTLAEVLITLGAIGVVAAFTIPTIAKNYYKHTVEVKLSKTYNDLKDAIKQSELDNGSLRYWDFSNGSHVFATRYILPYLSK